MRSHYWTCSSFANWIRGTPKPSSATSNEWKAWRYKAKQSHPVRFWLAEEGLDYAQKFVYFIPDKLYGIKYYIDNRFVTKTHNLTASSKNIPRGKWRDFGDRILPCLFDELANYVEVEVAYSQLRWDLEGVNRKKYNVPFWVTPWIARRKWRCPQAGIDHLMWEMNLKMDESYGVTPDNKDYNKPPQQAIRAKEIYELYTWWTKVRPMRPDPYAESGWDEYCKLLQDTYGDFLDGLEPKPDDPTTVKKGNQSHKRLISIEKKYNQEDEKMLIRLIKIRDSFWT